LRNTPKFLSIHSFRNTEQRYSNGRFVAHEHNIRQTFEISDITFANVWIKYCPNRLILCNIFLHVSLVVYQKERRLAVMLRDQT